MRCWLARTCNQAFMGSSVNSLQALYTKFSYSLRLMPASWAAASVGYWQRLRRRSRVAVRSKYALLTGASASCRILERSGGPL